MKVPQANQTAMPPPMSGPGEGLNADGPPACPTIPGFDIGGLLGVGGMGAVFEAWQEQPHRKVALKIMRPGLLTPEHLRYFDREINLLGRMEHPAIARIYSAGSVETSGVWQPYFVMEFIEGETLSDYTRNHSTTIREKIVLMHRIAIGVHHAHQKGVIHGDLKPSNIMVDASGQPRILDFGVARTPPGPISLSPDVTEPASRIGTPAYMAPELLDGRHDPMDVRSDIYALGVVMFEMLAERHPFPTPLPPADHANFHPPPLIPESSPGRPGGKSDLDWIVAKAMAPNNLDRYDSAAAFADDLQRFLDHRPVEAHPASSWYRATKFARRHRHMVAATGAAFLALSAGLGLALLNLANARRAERETALQKERAERNLQGAMDAVDQFMTTVARSSLSTLPAADDVRNSLLNDAAAFYEKFSADNQDHAALRESTQRALMRLTYMREQKHSSDGASVASLKERIAHLENRSTAATNQADLRFELAWSWHELADLFRARHEQTAYREARETALAVERDLVRQHPANAEYRRDLARNAEAWARELRELGEYQSAMEVHEEALSMYQGLIQDHPGMSIYDREWARCLEEMGKTRVRAGLLDQGMTQLAEASVKFRQIAEANADNASLMRDYSQNLIEQGKLLLKAKQYRRALDTFKAASRADHEINVRFPGHDDFRRDEARSLANCGLALNSLSDFAAADQYFREAETLYKDLLDRNPMDRRTQQEYAYLLGDWSKSMTHTPAIEKLNLARAAWQALAEAEPLNEIYSKSLAWVHREIERQEKLRMEPSVRSTNIVSFPRPVTNTEHPRIVRTEITPTPVQMVTTNFLSASDHAALMQRAGQMARVRGHVVAVFPVPGKSGVTLIKFGNARNDFCAAIHRRVLPDFLHVIGDDYGALPGHLVEIDGFLSVHRETPQIMLSKPNQIHILDEQNIHIHDSP